MNPRRALIPTGRHKLKRLPSGSLFNLVGRRLFNTTLQAVWIKALAFSLFHRYCGCYCKLSMLGADILRHIQRPDPALS
jgi:hypothetical protein